MTEPLPKPSINLHLSAPKFFERTTFKTAKSQKLDPKIKKAVNYIIGQIILYWPCGDESAVRTANLSLVVGHSFYQEQVRPNLERLKNLELRGKTYAPFDIRADGVCLINYITTKALPHLQKHGFVDLWNMVSASITTTNLFPSNSVFIIA
jgi:hypothetical protein